VADLGPQGSNKRRLKVTKKEHKQRHEFLHKALDELVADWLANTKNLPSVSTVMQLLSWSRQQALEPDHLLASDTKTPRK
jgi:citrate synthase